MIEKKNQHAYPSKRQQYAYIVKALYRQISDQLHSSQCAHTHTPMGGTKAYREGPNSMKRDLSLSLPLFCDIRIRLIIVYHTTYPRSLFLYVYSQRPVIQKHSDLSLYQLFFFGRSNLLIQYFLLYYTMSIFTCL